MEKFMELVMIAEKWYNPKKFAHAMRVAAMAHEMALYDSRMDSPRDAALVGLAHDLLEDTQIPMEVVSDFLSGEQFAAVMLLTKADDQSYDNYIKEILRNRDESPLAYLVKRADMKDHIAHMDTLTDKLRDKYLPHLAAFM